MKEETVETIIKSGATVVAGCGIFALGAMSGFISDLKRKREYDLRQARFDVEKYRRLYEDSIEKRSDLWSENFKLREKIKEYENGSCLILPLKETED